MREFLFERMRLYPNSRIRDEEKEYTYLEFMEEAKRHGENLLQAFPCKSKCGVLCKSNLWTALALLACWHADMVPIPMSLQYGLKHCEQIIEETEPDVLITDIADEDEFGQYLVGNRYDMNASLVVSLQKKVIPDPVLKDVGIILNTSGTTGRPKGAMIYTLGLQKNVEAIHRYLEIGPEDEILIARPMYHCAVLTGEYLVSLYHGVSILFLGGSEGMQYNPIAVSSLAMKEKVTLLGGTPTLFRHLARLQNRAKCESSLRVITLSGECMTEKVAKAIREAFPKTLIYHVYGMTEASPRISFLPPELFDQMPTCVGQPLYQTYIQVMDGEGVELAAGQPGNVRVKSPSIMKGYYRKEEQTAKKLEGGWLNTGDIGYMDEEGRLYILSRSDDMIIKAGMNIYPKEIENALADLPMIKEAVAYGVSELEGTGIGIDVVLNDGWDYEMKDLLSLIAGVLPSYQMPSKIRKVVALTRNASGKVVRNFGLTEQGTQGV